MAKESWNFLMKEAFPSTLSKVLLKISEDLKIRKKINNTNVKCFILGFNMGWVIKK